MKQKYARLHPVFISPKHRITDCSSALPPCIRGSHCFGKVEYPGGKSVTAGEAVAASLVLAIACIFATPCCPVCCGGTAAMLAFAAIGDTTKYPCDGIPVPAGTTYCKFGIPPICWWCGTCGMYTTVPGCLYFLTHTPPQQNAECTMDDINPPNRQSVINTCSVYRASEPKEAALAKPDNKSATPVNTAVMMLRAMLALYIATDGFVLMQIPKTPIIRMKAPAHIP